MRPQKRSAGRSAGVAAAIGVAILAWFVRLASLHAPVTGDTGQLLYGGSVMLHGGTPYLDAAVNKGPLVYPVFAVLRLLAGRSVETLRILFLLATLCTSGTLWAFAGRTGPAGTGPIVGLLFALLSATAKFQGADPNLEQFAVAPMALALLAATAPTRRGATLAGGLTGVVTLMSPDLLIATGPCVLLLVLAPRENRAGRLAAALGGGTLVCGGVAIWLTASGAISSFLIQVPGTSGRPAHISLHELLAVQANWLWLAGLLPALAALTQPRLRRPALVAASWIVLCWARTYLGDPLSGDRLFPQHDYPALVGIALGLGCGIRASWPGRRTLTALGAAVTIALAIDYVVLPQRDLFHEPVAQRAVGQGNWSAAGPLAAFVDAHTRPSQRIFVTGSEAQVYWLADRLSPTRLFDSYPVLAHPPYAEERASALRRSPPAAIVAVRPERIHGPFVNPATVGGDLAAARRVARYRLAYRGPAGRIWLRSHGP